MPLPVLEGYAAQLPQLEAAASLRRVTEVAVGSGTLTKHEQRRLLGSWRRAAAHGPRRVAAPRRLEERLELARYAGIRVEVEA